MSSFSDLPLDPALLANVAALGFDEPTAIQMGAIPPLLDGRDVIGRARTGSGKTAAFDLPLLQRVREGGGVGGLVLAPTRELAVQVTEALRSFAVGMDLPMVTLYGGAPYPPQLDALRRGVAIVVGTPGRILDHLERGSLDLSTVRSVVLDEADEMLRMGFIDDVEAILSAVPRPRQVALFSATMPPPIRRVAESHLSDPVEVGASQERARTDHVRQAVIKLTSRRKMDALQRILAGEAEGATLIFARTRAMCAEVADELGRRGVTVDALHGDLSQSARERVLGALRSQRLNVVVATDVAARGIDVDHITHVVNFDLPTDADTYVHRIGRTGRAGREGTAISFVTPAEYPRIKRWARELRADIVTIEAPSDADIAARNRVRLQARLAEGLTDAFDHGAARAFVEDALATGWKLHDLATAAIALLGAPAVAPPPRPDAPRADAHADSYDDRDGPPREARPTRRDDRFDGDDVQRVELFVPVGRSRGIRPGDLVGAIANEFDVPGAAIGKVTVVDHKSFIEVPAEIAERVVARGTLTLRGDEVPVDHARPRGGGSPGTRPPARKTGAPRKAPFHRPKWRE